MRGSYRIPVHRPADDAIEPWLNLTQAASVVGIAAKTLRLAAQRGDIVAIHPLDDGPWFFRRTDLEGLAACDLPIRAPTGAKAPAGPAPNQETLFPSIA